jgi:hypothetical protein
MHALLCSELLSVEFSKCEECRCLGLGHGMECIGLRRLRHATDLLLRDEPLNATADVGPNSSPPYRINPANGLDGSAPIRRGMRPAR